MWSCRKRSSFACQGQIQVADLVEKDSTAVGKLDLAAASDVRPRVRSLLVAEQFSLQKIVRNRRAIDGNERARPPLASLVDRLCHQFLSGSALALNKDGGI